MKKKSKEEFFEEVRSKFLEIDAHDEHFVCLDGQDQKNREKIFKLRYFS